MNNDICEEVNNVENKIEEKPKKDFRDSVYGKIDVSIKTMDKIIIVLFGLIIVSMIFGVMI